LTINNRTVYCLGETVLDIVFRNDVPISATPGGSMLNSAVSLGRAGLNVEFISEIASDKPGEMIMRFLHENHVGTTYVNRYSEGKTTIAMAFLNDRADATFSFYADHPGVKLPEYLPLPGNDNIILFGSFFSVTNGIFEKLTSFLSSARQNNALIIYDPNFRSPHLPELKKTLPRLIQNISFANIIRGSDEDFLHIFAMKEPGSIYSRVQNTENQVLMLTRSNEDVVIMINDLSVRLTVPPIIPVSTIGAGDSFNAGIIFAINKMGMTVENMHSFTEPDWQRIGENGIRFAQNVCMSTGNYISQDFITTDVK
jgi:fructokinase